MNHRLLTDLIDAHSDALLAQAKAKTTRKAYRSRVRHYVRWLGRPDADTGSITFGHISAFSVHLARRGNRPCTINGYLDALSNFCEWLVKQSLLAENPVRKVERPKTDDPDQKLISDEDLARCMAACSLLRTPRRRALARAVLSTFAYTAVRRTSVIDLRLSAVDLARNRLVVIRGKGGKNHELPLAPELREALCGWLAVRGECRHNYLWDFDGRRRLADEGLRTLLREVEAAAGLDAGTLLPHAVRHATASRLLARGANLKDIQYFLNHSNIATTFRYLHGDPRRLGEIVSQGMLTLPQQQDPPLLAPKQADARLNGHRLRTIVRR